MSDEPIEKTELTFNTEKFMGAIRGATASVSLREIAGAVNVSASTLSRIDNGSTPDMQTFIAICGVLKLTPGDFFEWIRWRRMGVDAP